MSSLGHWAVLKQEVALGAEAQMLLSLPTQPHRVQWRDFCGFLLKWKLLTSLQCNFISLASVNVFPFHPVSFL